MQFSFYALNRSSSSAEWGRKSSHNFIVLQQSQCRVLLIIRMSQWMGACTPVGEKWRQSSITKVACWQEERKKTGRKIYDRPGCKEKEPRSTARCGGAGW